MAREHERRAWGLRQRGRTQEQIAAELQITQQAVSKILARVSDRYLKQVEAKVGRIKAQQTAQLEQIVSESMDAWERSKKPQRTLTTVTRTGAEGQTSEQTTQQAVEQVGDVAYLDQARAALADLRKVWGIDAPQKVEHSGEMTQILEYPAPDEPDETPDPPVGGEASGR